ncbi:MAG: hypothetical protein Q4A36_00080 [Candidatus Saccharibacteria bacterium]|nr:hypothetical protein [Candidatus Saccharibacteria bacterium]
MGAKTFFKQTIKKAGFIVTITALIANYVLPIANTYADPPQPDTTAAVHYTYDGNGAADIFINNVMLEQGEPDPHPPVSGEFDGTINYHSGGFNTVNVTLTTFVTLSTITSVSINGTPYNVPTDRATLLGNVEWPVLKYDLGDIPKADTYNITTTTAPSTLMGNFSWSYKDSDKGQDNYVDNGIITLVELEYDNQKYYSKADIDAANLPYLRYEELDNGAYSEIAIPTGTKVTLKLMPNVGYQLTSFTVNGGRFEAQEEVGVYSFESVSGNFHLGAHFTAVDDAVAAEAEAVESGAITLGGTEFDNGTARLDVKDVDLDAEDIADFEDAAGDYKVKTYLDISLFQIIYKGTATDTWDEQIRELDNEATITLKLDESIDGNEIVIVHQKHDGTYEVIPTTYDPVNHTITFKTSSFSNYAIATKTVASPDTGVMTSEGASAIESGIMPLITIITLPGLAVFVTKKILA